MTLQAKKTHLDTFLTIGTHRFSLVSTSAPITLEREPLASNSLEYTSKREEAGAFMYPASIEGEPTNPSDMAALELLRGPGYQPYLKVSGNDPGKRGWLGMARVKRIARADPANQLSTFSAEIAWLGHACFGYLLANHMKGGPLTASAAGVAIQLPAVAADEEVVAALVESNWPGSIGDGRTLDAKTESATDSGFSSGVVDRHAFPQIATDPASEWADPIPGPLPSLWWRVNWTVAGDDPNYYPMALIGKRKAT